MRRLRTFGGLEADFAYIDANFLLGRPPLNSPSPEIGKVWVVSFRETSTSDSLQAAPRLSEASSGVLPTAVT
jgi:hypothetical protein